MMNGEVVDDEVHVGGDARQRFHDSRGYGYPLEGNRIALSRVEAAHLLLRGDLDTVDGADFQAFLSDQVEGFAARFLVYADLRDRGFYLSPDRDPWAPDVGDGDFVVYPRGKGPKDDDLQYRIRVVGERTAIPAAGLQETSVVLAVVDEESDITYFDVDTADPTGESSTSDVEGVTGVLLDDRVVVWEPPEQLHQQGFYGQPLGGRGSEHDALQLSLLEAAYLAATGVLGLEGEPPGEGGTLGAVVERGRAVEGDRFDRRLRVYRALRNRGMVPKTGYKFGSDFRVYETVESVDDLGHSTMLVRALPLGHAFDPREVALDVRLAHGVRKRMVFALDDTEADTIEWLVISRLTP